MEVLLMSTLIRKGGSLLVALSVIGAAPAAAQKKTGARAVLTVPAAGTFADGGEFKGTISINRFERRGNEIVAIGFVVGVLSRGSHAIGTAVAGETAWTVRVSASGIAVANTRGPARPTLTRVAWTPDVAPTASFLRVQAGESCPVLNVALGPNSVDLLGFQVALSGVTLDIAGATGTPLGDLVCAASDLLGNVAAIVNLLNSILGLVTGLLGGLTGGLGGLGGAIPVP
jgi:hypothetical protein